MADQRKEPRPHIPSIDCFLPSAAEEGFQNETLRPILKMQHPLLIEAFIYHLKKRKLVDRCTTFEAQQAVIESVFQKDIAFRNLMIGMIIGQFTKEEFVTYTANTSEIHKRIIGMLKQRIGDSRSEWI